MRVSAGLGQGVKGRKQWLGEFTFEDTFIVLWQYCSLAHR